MVIGTFEYAYIFCIYYAYKYLTVAVYAVAIKTCGFQKIVIALAHLLQV